MAATRKSEAMAPPFITFLADAKLHEGREQSRVTAKSYRLTHRFYFFWATGVLLPKFLLLLWLITLFRGRTAG